MVDGTTFRPTEQLANSQVRLPKKLIVCCDGTWMDADNGYSGGKLQNPSNVTRIARAIMFEDDAKHPQIVYYQSGIGTGLGLYDQVLGGGTGIGLSEHIREAYSFLGMNYSPDDHLCGPDSIFLIGFSRGAFTARSLGGFIAAVGVLTRKAMPYFYECFSDWENVGVAGYKPRFLDAYCRANPDERLDARLSQPDPAIAHSRDVGAIDEYMRQYKNHLLSLGLTQEAQIKCIGVWDTVGALGIPVNPVFQGFLPAFIKEYSWYDTRLSNAVENAFHALALDERRFPFSPAIWERDDTGTTNLKQVWFPGAHSNVGGSYDDYGMANITLAWMMDQLSGNTRDPNKAFDPLDWIRFDDDFINLCFRQSSNYYASNSGLDDYNGWAMGKVYDSNTFPQSLAGAKVRTPGRYQKTDYLTGKNTGVPLSVTNEYIHSSVRARMDLAGRGVEPQAWHQKIFSFIWRLITFQKAPHLYQPQCAPRWKGFLAQAGPLYSWKLIDGHPSHDIPNMTIDMSPGGLREAHWKFEGNGKCTTDIFKEDVFAEGGYEERLLLHDQEVASILSSNRYKRPRKEWRWSKTF
ncbi:uncharacterized protein SEPMUDRAFT_161935 [Sphaerulina musiva SO2202]|uniref:T6SS Phospholipase effector Tle1-like catalytic domain-containing protein n=1 Tax=Sphaerulina musiva (strain SO2202) TaxID=692275 RepID=M3CQ53_SPHMS|nr:uncharacterized protein SEPMUDRAFT_161935 [Sphaerulina musiva SO2202]EMF15838.1 hypothetical protein SEPMUDRAFT_161935 [Sphaerulina musiva SO2202]